jgi:glycosyltransferase involved in cell wall biosynthesis
MNKGDIGKRAERIRIALLGNMNNNHFALAQYLRMYGYDCMLLLFDCEQDHFLPSCDAYDTSYMAWTKTLSWGSSRGFMGTSSSIISADLSDYDVIIGCGLSPAFCNKAGINLDVMVPYGSDIWLETMFRLVSLHTLPSVWLSVLMQRIGLGKVNVLHCSITNDTYEKQIQRYSRRANRWYEGVPIVFAPNYEKDTDLINKTHWGFEFLRIRKSCEFMVIAHSRHIWTDPSNMSSKGNDMLLKGWALFCEQTPDIKKQLILIEYGKDVLKSKQYVKELGIEESVTWLPKMYRKDIMPGLFMADMVAAEFVHSWMTGGVLYEALVASKPILTYRDDALYQQEYPFLYPIYNANTPETIRSRLEEYLDNPEAGKKIGLLGRKWYEEEVVTKAVCKYSKYIDRRASKLGKLAHH